jgi:hypothetical protein
MTLKRWPVTSVLSCSGVMLGAARGVESKAKTIQFMFLRKYYIDVIYGFTVRHVFVKLGKVKATRFDT